uniref:Uncharacterized protein n=1 Tax=Caenorhabditis japonica TaxID=281687 RepID=A0A8R1EPG9_CAEJA
VTKEGAVSGTQSLSFAVSIVKNKPVLCVHYQFNILAGYNMV